MKCQERNEDAASPVIGVMLMLVVTVVIAAVITAFATGMAGDSTATTPMALIEADNPQLKSISQWWGDTNNFLGTFDLVHKGGDEMVLENIQVVIEPIGGAQFGVILVRSGNNENQLKVLGKENQKGEAVVSTGDRIRVLVYESSSLDEAAPGTTIVWTLSDVRTTGVIAKGEFVVPEP